MGSFPINPAGGGAGLTAVQQQQIALANVHDLAGNHASKTAATAAAVAVPPTTAIRTTIDGSPAYRGASQTAWTILDGDERDPGLDHGAFPDLATAPDPLTVLPGDFVTIAGVRHISDGNVWLAIGGAAVTPWLAPTDAAPGAMGSADLAQLPAGTTADQYLILADGTYILIPALALLTEAQVKDGADVTEGVVTGERLAQFYGAYHLTATDMGDLSLVAATAPAGSFIQVDDVQRIYYKAADGAIERVDSPDGGSWEHRVDADSAIVAGGADSARAIKFHGNWVDPVVMASAASFAGTQKRLWNATATPVAIAGVDPILVDGVALTEIPAYSMLVAVSDGTEITGLIIKTPQAVAPTDPVLDVADAAGLTALTGMVEGDFALQTDDGSRHIYDGLAWQVVTAATDPVIDVADAAALAALTGMIEGDIAQQGDDDSYHLYDGAAWRPLATMVPPVESAEVTLEAGPPDPLNLIHKVWIDTTGQQWPTYYRADPAVDPWPAVQTGTYFALPSVSESLLPGSGLGNYIDVYWAGNNIGVLNAIDIVATGGDRGLRISAGVAFWNEDTSPATNVGTFTDIVVPQGNTAIVWKHKTLEGWHFKTVKGVPSAPQIADYAPAVEYAVGQLVKSPHPVDPIAFPGTRILEATAVHTPVSDPLDATEFAALWTDTGAYVPPVVATGNSWLLDPADPVSGIFPDVATAEALLAGDTAPKLVRVGTPAVAEVLAQAEIPAQPATFNQHVLLADRTWLPNAPGGTSDLFADRAEYLAALPGLDGFSVAAVLDGDDGSGGPYTDVVLMNDADQNWDTQNIFVAQGVFLSPWRDIATLVGTTLPVVDATWINSTHFWLTTPAVPFSAAVDYVAPVPAMVDGYWWDGTALNKWADSGGIATPVNVTVNGGADTIAGLANTPILEGSAYHLLIDLPAGQMLDTVTGAIVANAHTGEVVVQRAAGAGDLDITATFKTATPAVVEVDYMPGNNIEFIIPGELWGGRQVYGRSFATTWNMPIGWFTILSAGVAWELVDAVGQFGDQFVGTGSLLGKAMSDQGQAIAQGSVNGAVRVYNSRAVNRPVKFYLKYTKP